MNTICLFVVPQFPFYSALLTIRTDIFTKIYISNDLSNIQLNGIASCRWHLLQRRKKSRKMKNEPYCQSWHMAFFWRIVRLPDTLVIQGSIHLLTIHFRRRINICSEVIQKLVRTGCYDLLIKSKGNAFEVNI